MTPLNEIGPAPASSASLREAMMAAVGFSPRSGAVPKSSCAATTEPIITMPALSPCRSEARNGTDASPNPKGIPTQSPGLRGTSYPGNERAHEPQPQRGCGKPLAPSSHNPVGVDRYAPGFPKVARASQPWAGGRNPVGID